MVATIRVANVARMVAEVAEVPTIRVASFALKKVAER
jgi:hypothetical protein